MEEFTYTLLENGSIERKDKKYVLSRGASDIEVPDTIQGIIAARMDRLEDNLKRTMQVASVIGRDFAFRILQTITGMREELKSYLLNLQGLEFIYEKSLFPELEYIFKHALTREVAYNSLLLKRRKEIHEKIGDAIEKIYTDRLEEFYEVLAYHYSRGEAFEKACRYFKLSGNKATRGHALWEAYAFYKEAVELLERLPETKEKKKELVEVIRLMRVPLGLLMFPEGSLSFFQRGERLAKELGDAGLLAAIYSGISQYYNFMGDYVTAMGYSEEAFEEARKEEDIELMAPLGTSLCLSWLGAGQFEKIVHKMPEVISLFEKTGRESDFSAMGMNPYSYICGHCGLALGLLGRFEEGKAYLEKALANAIRLGDPATLWFTQCYYGLLLTQKGDFEAAKERLEKCLAHGEEAKLHGEASASLCILGYVHSLLGDPGAGRRQAEEGLRMYRESGVEYLLSYFHWMMSSIHLELSDLANAGISMEEALRLSRKNGERWVEGYALVGLGMVFAKREPPQSEQARECFSEGLTILQELKIKPWYSQGRMFLGEFYLDTGEKEKAMENLKEAEVMFQEMGMDYWLSRTHAVYANLYKKEGDLTKAKENLNKAIEILKDCGADGWVEKYEKELAALS
jgi:tetratricopeptide (TPR) repeat protein